MVVGSLLLSLRVLLGKKQSAWKQSLHHLAKPLSDYFLSLHQSLPSVTQPVVVVSYTVSRSVSGPISASLPCLLPQVSQSESLNSTGTLSDAVQGDSVSGNHSPCLYTLLSFRSVGFFCR